MHKATVFRHWKTSSPGLWSLREETLTRLWSGSAIQYVTQGEEDQTENSSPAELRDRSVGKSPKDSRNVQSRMTQRKTLARKAAVSDLTGVPQSLWPNTKPACTGKDSTVFKYNYWGQNNYQRATSRATTWTHMGLGRIQAPKSQSGENIRGTEQRHQEGHILGVETV